jgi:hypothetical protein
MTAMQYAYLPILSARPLLYVAFTPVKRSTIHRMVNELPTRKMHASQKIFLGYIEIVYISTHIGIESVSGDGLQLATRMRQAQRCRAPL